RVIERQANHGTLLSWSRATACGRISRLPAVQSVDGGRGPRARRPTSVLSYLGERNACSAAFADRVERPGTRGVSEKAANDPRESNARAGGHDRYRRVARQRCLG